MRKHPILPYWGAWFAEAFAGSWNVYDVSSGLLAVVLFLAAQFHLLPAQVYGYDVNDLASWIGIGLFGGTLLLRLAMAPYRLQLQAMAAGGQGVNAGRVILSITPHELMAMLKGHTDIQKARLLTDYMGKWMRVTGPITNVTEGRFPREWKVYIDLGVVSLAELSFGGDWRERVSVLRVGEVATVVGRISSVTIHTVNLRECELEAVAPSVMKPARNAE